MSAPPQQFAAPGRAWQGRCPATAFLALIPTAPESTVRVVLEATATAPRLARHRARATLAAWGASEDTLDAAELAVTELVTNAVVHAGSGEANRTRRVQPVLLTLRRVRSRLVIGVWDHDERPPASRTSGPRDTDGRGLAVVAAVAERWSWSPAPVGGKVVWCELRLGDARGGRESG
jgi:anti-sigma regulatory factor (Ser/Thr protein kinase)